MSYSTGDILFVSFPYDDKNVEKGRPVLFWDEDGDLITVSKITKKARGLPWELPLPSMDENGLDLCSYVRQDQTVQIHKDKIRKPIPLGNVNQLQLKILHLKLLEYLNSIK